VREGHGPQQQSSTFDVQGCDFLHSVWFPDETGRIYR